MARVESRRVAALDGVRGVAIVMVLVGHSVPRMGYVGLCGVAVFFALSGYLITSILVRQREAGTFSPLAFWRRRAVRLLPALVVLMGLGILLVGERWLRPSIWVFSYTGNVGRIYWDALPAELGHMWSLAVEEQYYLIWPLLLLVLGRRRLLPVALLLCVASILWRFHVMDGSIESMKWVLFGTDTNIYAMLAGSALALWGRGTTRTGPDLGTVYLLLAVAVAMVPALWALPVAPVLAALATVALVAHPGGWLQWRWLGALGLVSYGVYLWHMPLLEVSRHLGGGAWGTITALAASLVIATLSWRYLERPLLEWERNRRPRPHRAEHAETSLIPTREETLSAFSAGGQPARRARTRGITSVP